MSEKRPRIHWFSPLPPAHTDIAQYAMRTLPVLAKYCDVVAWTPQHYWPRALEAYVEVRLWKEHAWPALNTADAAVFHLGNNIEFHGWIWEIARQHPGIVVLHDVRLHEFFASVLMEHAGHEADYVAAVRRCHGEAGAAQAQRLLQGRTNATELAETLPMTDLALARARGAIVHTRAAWEAVRDLRRCPVLQLDLPFAAGPEPPARDWDGTLRLVVFGYLGPNRRLPSVLQAIASFPRRDRVQLDIFGELRDVAATEALIEELALTGQVRLHGFVREAELDAALDRAHLAINLRYPTMGEASGSQLRIWSRALAGVVTRTGSYADLPPATVWFVDPENEIAHLHDHFNRALENPEILFEMGRAGRRYLIEHHSPERYASDLADGIVRMMEAPASIIEPITTSVAAVLTASGMKREAQASVARRAAGELTRWLEA